MLRIHFVNWWDSGYNTFFHFFLKKYIDRDIVFSSTSPDLVIYSVFGDRKNIQKHLKNRQVNIFYTGESTQDPRLSSYDDYLLDTVDLSLGFKYLEHPRYLRFPMWLTYPMTWVDMEDIVPEHPHLNLKNFSQFTNVENKNKFCCILSSHDKFGTRSAIFHRLSLYQKVDSGSTWNKNIDYNIDTHTPTTNKLYDLFLKHYMHHRIKFWESYWALFKRRYNAKQFYTMEMKYHWLKEYKFNISCESLLAPGYITEKVFESLLSGCIPIYLVADQDTPVEEEVLNQEVMIKFTPNRIEEAVERVIQLDQDPDRYRKFVSQRILTENAREYIIERYELLADKIKSALKEKSS